MRRLLALLLTAAALAGCDLAEDPFRPEPVVEAVLVAGEPLADVRLSRTVPVEERYDFVEAAVAGATVTVTRLRDGQPYPYFQKKPGVYTPADRGALVEPGERYRLTVELLDGSGLGAARLSAETLVPDTFAVVVPPDSVVAYDPFGPAPGLVVTPSAYPGRQAIYLFSIVAQDTSTCGLTPTYGAFADGDADAGDFANGSSPLLNEANYEVTERGNLRLRIPWLAVAFFGTNEFTANALDDALFDFIRSRDAQVNPTTLSPGEIQSVLSNVENGAGVFGSVAQQTTRVFIAGDPACAPSGG